MRIDCFCVFVLVICSFVHVVVFSLFVGLCGSGVFSCLLVRLFVCVCLPECLLVCLRCLLCLLCLHIFSLVCLVVSMVGLFVCLCFVFGCLSAV